MTSYFAATPADRDEFDSRGFVFVKELLTPAEAERLRRAAVDDGRVRGDATARSDAAGAQTVLAVRDQLGDDPYSRIARSRRIAGSMAVLLGEEVYHYHHKLMLKEPRVGGAWEWHQDYGYWYGYGCLYPRMASCYIAIDAATRENGCLQVLPGSHHLGRIDHRKIGGQTGADPDRMAPILERFEPHYVEMEPGDGLFFHANLLHRSDQNRSTRPRWSLICCYNTKSNSPYSVIRHNAYEPLPLLDDEAVLA